MVIGYIRLPQFYSKVEKRGGEYHRTSSHGPGQRKIRSVVSDLEAAKLCAYSDWVVCDELREAKDGPYPYQAILAQLGDL